MQEASVMTSLHELRAIEQERIADERAARERAREAEEAVRRAAEAARLADIAARERAVRDEQLRIEEARVAAEREARMRVEAHEAAERARLAAQLEQERLAQEMELRRADIAKRRPKWMVAVTVFAVLGGAGFAALAIDRMHDADNSQAAAQRADAETAAAKKDAADAVAKLDAMQKTLDELDGKVREAQHAVAIATNKLELEAAQARLAEANRKDAEAHARQIELQRIKDKQDRDHKIDVSKCAGQVLCK
jgi:hypothetical protein